MKKNEYVEELLGISNSQKQDDVCISVYIQKVKETNEQLKNRLKPSLNALLKQNTSNKDVTDFHKEIVEVIISSVELDDDNADGYAIFACTNTDALAKNKQDELLQYIKVVPLYSLPHESSFIGNTFDLTQLLFPVRPQSAAFALDITRDRANLYLFDKHECTHIHTFETEIMPEQATEYSEKQGTGVVHGNGEDKIERRHLEENKYLLQQVKEVLTQMQEQVQDVGYVVVAYTSQFYTIISDFVDSLQKDVQPAVVLTLQKNIKDAQELQTEVEELLQEHSGADKVQQYDRAQEAFTRFVLDASDILSAASQGGVQTLFLTLGQEIPGYITDNVVLSKEPLSEASVRCENILPTLVQRVIQTNGTIVSFGPETEDMPMMAALLRYDKENITRIKN